MVTRDLTVVLTFFIGCALNFGLYVLGVLSAAEAEACCGVSFAYAALIALITRER